jgi:hypothetical protein
MSVLGKRYFCDTCGSIVLCCAAGDGQTKCCGDVMLERAVKPLPSSD